VASAFCLRLASAPADAATPALREVYARDFLIGAAVPASVVSKPDSPAAALLARQFSSLTPENDLKWDHVQPRPGEFTFRAADALVAFGEKHKLAVIGHTLVWHSQTPAWVFTGPDGQPASADELRARMRTHIETVAGRYCGRIRGWDVVNEAVADGGPEVLRDSPWRRILGEDFVELAFRIARETDPKAELYYNDYNLEQPAKRKRALALLRRLKERGAPIDGVGLQGHYNLQWPPAAEVDATIREFSALGLKVMITELDVNVLPSRGPQGVADVALREDGAPELDPYRDGLPAQMQQRLAARYAELFGVFLRHREQIDRVTFWGLHDGASWLNDWPVRGRRNHPLLFDRDLKPKPAFQAVVPRPAVSAAP
jgi:endo-1,4-beta-xylanase